MDLPRWELHQILLQIGCYKKRELEKNHKFTILHSIGEYNKEMEIQGVKNMQSKGDHKCSLWYPRAKV